MNFISTINFITGGILISIFLFAAITSYFEHERRAVFWSIFGAACIIVVYIVPFVFVSLRTGTYAFILFGSTTVFGILLIYNPKQTKYQVSQPTIRHDERETMFSRQELKPGTRHFDAYYNEKPWLKTKDDAFRTNPGLVSGGSSFFKTVPFAAARASFGTVKQLADYIHGVPSNIKTDISSEKLTRFIMQWAKKLGALDTGICQMHDYHYYHTKGRGKRYGEAVEPKYRYGIAFTVEMDAIMMRTAPKSPVVMESAEQYLNSGIIAVQLAAFIRNLGYGAMAHIDGNYEVICPLVARDAGLGEIGRMGLLMTPRQGPRVRIAVVTTNAPLETTVAKVGDESMIEFCSLCKKCADNCPGQSIPFDERNVSDGSLRWKIDHESCYTYWTKAGTDCGRCMRVCPFAHPDNLIHNMVRFGIKHSKLFRRIALWMDDLFYGRKPRINKLPSWAKHN